MASCVVCGGRVANGGNRHAKGKCNTQVPEKRRDRKAAHRTKNKTAKPGSLSQAGRKPVPGTGRPSGGIKPV